METYFRLLNCGLRIAPSACSGSGGKCDNPPGYNRVYVACGGDFTAETWFRNLRAGRVVISNGPLLRVRINDELPGHTFEASAGGEVTLENREEGGARACLTLPQAREEEAEA